jgi:heme-degrading monooxygenase HmoA
MKPGFAPRVVLGRILSREHWTMPEIQEHNHLVTQITTVKLQPDTEQEVLGLMVERARFMATQPGFVSVSLHRSNDGSHLVNYIQWADRELLEAAHRAPEFRKEWPRFGELVEDVDPCLYEVVHIERERHASRPM